MKKWAMFGLMMALTAMTGCHKDDEGYIACDADSVVMHCEEGNVVSCVMDVDSRRGHLHVESSFVYGDVVYVCKDGEVVIDNACDGDKVVLQNDDKAEAVCGLYGTVFCSNGVAVESASDACEDSQGYPDVSKFVSCKEGNLILNGGEGDYSYGPYMCDQISGSVYHCDADRLVKHDALCDAQGAVMCVSDGGAWRIDKTVCSNDEACVEYQKGSAKYAACFNKSNVGDSCGNVKVYGECENETTLVVCSSDGQGGKLLHIDCAAQGESMGVTRKCGKIEDSNYGYDCRTVCEDNEGNEYDEFGTCTDENVLHYCNQQGQYEKPLACTTCGWNNQYNDFDCI